MPVAVCVITLHASEYQIKAIWTFIVRNLMLHVPRVPTEQFNSVTGAIVAHFLYLVA